MVIQCFFIDCGNFSYGVFKFLTLSTSFLLAYVGLLFSPSLFKFGIFSAKYTLLLKYNTKLQTNYLFFEHLYDNRNLILSWLLYEKTIIR